MTPANKACCGRRSAHAQARRHPSNLQVSGFEVQTAADRTEAFEPIHEHPFDLLQADIRLPGADGVQVLDAIRRELKTPVVMLSGRGHQRDKVSALDVGTDDYLTTLWCPGATL
jgi:DNA-binding response OmpR family regulator